ncbi:MAG: hypothetical protein ABIP91_01540, partial [Sphingomicrobium sp.]
MTAQALRVPALPSRRPARRERLLLSCAAVALATVALPAGRAHAQAFQGRELVASGSAVRTITGSFTETITVGTPTATIDWSPYDAQGTGTIDFLPAGNTATFTNNPATTADFTVLNRIIPTDLSRPVAFNGTVISQLQDLSQNVSPGGSVWFYSPGGIVVGSTAVFDVGSLLLTTNDVTSFSTSAGGFTGRFLATPASTSAITVAPGAQINATATNSYVALVAPRIVQGGAVRVDGSAAYAAGEDVTMTMNQGLFDIQVNVGTGDSNGVVHSGSTGGPSSTGAGDNHRVYMVAVPKNQALTMLLGGSAGFDAATSASIENGQIVLAAGYSVSGDTFNGDFLGGAIGGTPASISIAGGDYGSSVTGQATGSIAANGGGGTLNFDHDVTLQALQASSLTAFTGETITVGSDATISADDMRYFDNQQLSLNAQGGSASMTAQSGGSITIAGAAAVTANAYRGVDSATGVGGIETGGIAALSALGGNITIGGNTNVQATAFGLAAVAGVDGSDAFGGSASLAASNGGSVDVGGALDVSAFGGAAGSGIVGGTGGDGHGGTVTISANGGAIAVTGQTRAWTEGEGGDAASGTGGSGYGSDLLVIASNGGSLALGANFLMSAVGFGGDGSGQGGLARGGDAILSFDGGSVNIGTDLEIYADGLGGFGATGGSGTGGAAAIVFTSAGGALTVGGSAAVESSGVGGGGADNAGGAGGTGGIGQGGGATFDVPNILATGASATVQIAGQLFVDAVGIGGAGGGGLTGGAGGDAFGGTSRFLLGSGTAAIDDLEVFSTGIGGVGGIGSSGAGGAGGDGSGGFADIIVGGALTSRVLLARTRGRAAAGGAGTTAGAGGSAWGGNTSVNVSAGGSATVSELVDIMASAIGANGGVGGSAVGGSATLNVAGTMT